MEIEIEGEKVKLADLTADPEPVEDLDKLRVYLLDMQDRLTAVGKTLQQIVDESWDEFNEIYN